MQKQRYRLRDYTILNGRGMAIGAAAGRDESDAVKRWKRRNRGANYQGPVEAYRDDTPQDNYREVCRYGNCSEKQAKYLGVLINRFDNWALIDAKRKAEYEEAETCFRLNVEHVEALARR